MANNREPLETDAEFILTDLPQRVLVFDNSVYFANVGEETAAIIPTWMHKLALYYHWRITDSCGYPTVEAEGIVGHLLLELETHD